MSTLVQLWRYTHLFTRNVQTRKHLPLRRHFAVTTTPIPEITEAFPQIRTHEDLYSFSIQNPNEFWGRLASSRLEWQKKFTQVEDHDYDLKNFKWFPDGQLNAAVNCVDRHAAVDPDRVALIWEKDEPGQEVKVTYSELKNLVCRFGSVLRGHGVKQGDRVALYLPVSPIAVAAMLACARVGAVHSIVFAGFSADSLASRIIDAQADVVITADQAVRGGKIIELKKTVDEAVSKCPNVRQVFVSKRTGADVKMGPRDIDLDQAISEASADCPPAVQNAEDLLFLLYTSGSTGTPKGVAHSTAGYLLYAATTFKHCFDYREGDIFGCVADIGWITGHSYIVYGPLANGATTLLFESTPSYPDHGRYWETVERLKLTHFYTSPTALRHLLRFGDKWPQMYDRSSLRVLGCVGEPLTNEAWHWFNDVVGERRCSLVDTWWQTETGGIMLSPLPSSPGAPITPCKPMRPMFGINPVLKDANGHTLEGNGVEGAMCIDTIWPGISRTVYGDHSRYVNTYFSAYPGCYFSGDGALRDSEGYYQITGRMDDVINVSGHRLGTAEVEDILNKHDDVAETAVVGFPHDIKGESIYAFVLLKENIKNSHEVIMTQMKSSIKSAISGYAIPEHILMVPSLPKTRSGKIMRRILRKIASDKFTDLGDISTLAEPACVEQIIQRHKDTNSK